MYIRQDMRLNVSEQGRSDTKLEKNCVLTFGGKSGETAKSMHRYILSRW